LNVDLLFVFTSIFDLFARLRQQKSLICLPNKLGFFELSVPQAEREICFASEAHIVREVCRFYNKCWGDRQMELKKQKKKSISDKNLIE